ncbi:hypothetical protein [Geminisphaera colitermitum]|uniref:hypothetical protein n=1 Tax=Geminisphaera colitermitum TaxID=1148786 RepID=UPI000158C874|nr:hypothetical protein [Geminisphaera colitermitum]
MPNAAQLQGGKAVCPRPRRTYTPCEASAAAEQFGFFRSARWWSDRCKTGKVRTLAALRPFHYITEEELMRVIGIVDLAETGGES